MTKRLMVICFIGCLFSLSARNGYACFCITPEALQAFRAASAVFVGEVIEIVEPSKQQPKSAADRSTLYDQIQSGEVLERNDSRGDRSSIRSRKGWMLLLGAIPHG